MDRHMAEQLDKYITGNYGEDQYNDEEEAVQNNPDTCLHHYEYDQESGLMICRKCEKAKKFVETNR